jgi:alkanesulfonate monooxygenase SsuD/methylene tetrahydromethanopterin reductase-like flavin-dependent oxidoreductase (luciferase family)
LLIKNICATIKNGQQKLFLAEEDSSMRYGVYLPSVGEYSDPALLAELAQEAEQAGWDGVFIWDHIGQPNTAADPWVALAAMAMNTEHIKLGPVVTPVARRRPWKLARETVTLDQLSNGRLILAVGLGWRHSEFETFGETGDPHIRAEKLDEGLDVLAGLWSGELFSYSGKHYQVNEACFLPRPVQSPRIPIWACGAWSDKRAPFRRAARWDGVVAIPSERRAIRPDEVRAIDTYIRQHRTTDDPFDIVVILWSEGSHTKEEHLNVAEHADAGVTWWLEELSTERFDSQQAVRARLHQGPPGS